MIRRQGQAEFQARVARINSGRISHVPQPGVADGSGACWLDHKSAMRMRKPEARVAAPPSCVCGFFLGLVAYLLAQYGRFHLLGLPDPQMTPDIRMLLNGVGAMAVLAVLSLVFAAPTGKHVAVRLLGIAVAMGTMHNLVHFFPEHFETAFSAEWVQLTQAMTEPGSILFRGVSYPLT